MVAVARASARGLQKQTFQLFARSGLFEWGGCFLDGTPANCPDNKLRLHVNGLLRNGVLIPRGGQSKMTPSTIHSGACVKGIWDFHVGTPKTLFVFGDGCPGVSSGTGFSANYYDPEASPNYQAGVYYNGTTVGLVGATFGGDLYLGEDTKLRKYISIRPPYGTTALGIGGSSQDIPLIDFTGTTGITALRGFDGRLFVAVDDGAGSSFVTTWDGVSEIEDVGSLNAPTYMIPYRETLVMGFGGSPNEIHVRPLGAPPQSWATVAPSGGTAVMKQAVVYKDKLYFTTLDEDLFSFDGTTLTQIPVATSGLPASADTFGIEVFGGNLYVSYTDVGNTDAELAKFDGTTWTGSHKNWSSDDANITAARAMRAYRGYLYAAVIHGGQGRLLRSPDDGDLTGTWTQISQGTIAGDINDLVVF